MDGQAPLLGEAGKKAAAAEPDACIHVDVLRNDGTDGRAGEQARGDKVGRVERWLGLCSDAFGKVVEAYYVFAGGRVIKDGFHPDAVFVKAPWHLQAGSAVHVLVGERNAV